MNGSGSEMCAWSFRKAEKFFDVVTYTGNGTAGRTISHNLDSVPGMIMVKNTSNTKNWAVYHRGANSGTNPEQYTFLLNSSNPESSSATGDWNDTAPTSTEFTVGNGVRTNENAQTFVAYLFAHDAQDFGEDSDEAIIKCGSYTGNDGTQDIDVGFEPQWLLIKCSSDSGNWVIIDMMRGFIVDSSADSTTLQPNTSNAESSSTAGRVGPRPNGFGFINESGVDLNAIRDYVYVAIRRPHKPASEFAATKLFDVDYRITGDPTHASGFVTDMGIVAARTGGGTIDYHAIGSRLTSPKRMQTTSTAVEVGGGKQFTFDYSDGWGGDDTESTFAAIYSFRRAKGFFDVVTYTGSSSVQNVAHNLGAAPEMMWIKRREAAVANWAVYHSAMGNDKAVNLNTDKSYLIATDGQFNSTTPTASVFTVGANYSTTNNNGRLYIAYLFASVSGISKVGSYTGTGNDLNVDCGFSAGARFVLIKRWDRVGGSFGSNGDWYVYDTLRGIVAGNDPYIFLNTTAVEVTNTDYIDPDNSGFIVTSSAPDALNASGGSYLFYAIA